MPSGKSSLMLGNKFPFISDKGSAEHKDRSLNGVLSSRGMSLGNNQTQDMVVMCKDSKLEVYSYSCHFFRFCCY